jgi:uncharacterized SAM-binding protein YcdF (DUF218 family)
MSIFRRLSRLAVLSLAGVGLCWIAVTTLPIAALWLRVFPAAWPEPKGDVLIVLGNDGGGPIVGGGSYWRCYYAVRLWRQGGFTTLVVSGDNPVAESMASFLVAGGVPQARILVEGRSRSTRENALRTAELLRGEAGRKVLLTSDYHMFRAWRAFRKAGLDTVSCPTPDAAKRANTWHYRQSVCHELLVETVKIAWYWFQGWI